MNIGDKVDVISTFYDDKVGEIKSQNILSSKEIILMSGNFDYKMDNQTENINNQKQNSFSFLDFSEGDINSLDGLTLYITFYLTGEEAESIFKSLEYGNLNLAICSSRGFLMTKEGKIILFMGSKGGCGQTFISNCIANYLASHSALNILMIDMNLGSKDSRIIYKISEEDVRTIFDIKMMLKILMRKS